MHQITLLSSFHIKLGSCNYNELYKIIENIQPDIIFEELSSTIFDIIYADGFNPESLEAIAIKKYLKKYPVEHIPVDTYAKNETDLFNGYDIISNKSTEYTRLFKQQLSLINQLGYSFLNSNNFDEVLDKMHEIERNVLLEINDTKLSDQYTSDSELHDKRENEMLWNIYHYSKQHPYNKAIFISGAEHRKSIIQKISEYERIEKLKLNWIFYDR